MGGTPRPNRAPLINQSSGLFVRRRSKTSFPFLLSRHSCPGGTPNPSSSVPWCNRTSLPVHPRSLYCLGPGMQFDPRFSWLHSIACAPFRTSAESSRTTDKRHMGVLQRRGSGEDLRVLSTGLFKRARRKLVQCDGSCVGLVLCGVQVHFNLFWASVVLTPLLSALDPTFYPGWLRSLQSSRIRFPLFFTTARPPSFALRCAEHDGGTNWPISVVILSASPRFNREGSPSLD